MDLSKEVKKELKKEIDACPKEKIKDLISKYSKYELKGEILGSIFEKLYVNIETGFSPVILISELEKIHHSFHTSNGGDWCRSKQSYLGKKYIIIRNKSKGSIFSVKCDGPQKENFAEQNIREDIKRFIKKQNCVILDISTNIECDHKDGKKDDSRLNSLEDQKLEDFQPLCKTANMAKKSHCKKCREEGKRYDATQLGYSSAFTWGDENTRTCVGCYWHDPKSFNRTISKDYKKED